MQVTKQTEVKEVVKTVTEQVQETTVTIVLTDQEAANLMEVVGSILTPPSKVEERQFFTDLYWKLYGESLPLSTIICDSFEIKKRNGRP